MSLQYFVSDLSWVSGSNPDFFDKLKKDSKIWEFFRNVVRMVITVGAPCGVLSVACYF